MSGTVSLSRKGPAKEKGWRLGRPKPQQGKMIKWQHLQGKGVNAVALKATGYLEGGHRWAKRIHLAHTGQDWDSEPERDLLAAGQTQRHSPFSSINSLHQHMAGKGTGRGPREQSKSHKATRGRSHSCPWGPVLLQKAENNLPQSPK